jgi:predicted dehydrogenase/threonine dehydrogenase-like Zn-dependent dehydrogenase
MLLAADVPALAGRLREEETRRMKQIVQNARTGALEIADVPAPRAGAGQLQVRNHFSVVSPGTEALALDFARKSLAQKARSRPDLVRQVVRKLRDEGPLATYQTVVNRLDSPQALGYSSAGVVIDVGPGVSGFAVGDRVACAGAGYANHAEIIVVPENLAVAIPDGVATEHGAFATIGAIALQGVRIAGPTLGEVGVVIGLGLIGQLTVQLLRANGCRVLGVDLQERRVKQALEQGAEWGASPDAIPQGWRESATGGHGADFVIVAASAKSAAPIQLAAELCRARGRVVIVGAMPMELDRRSFYEKELELRMSMSYGPGRYDRRFEEHGLDYPVSYVRWTENRNLGAFLQLVRSNSLRLDALQPKIQPFADAIATYEALARGESSELAVVFQYDANSAATPRIELATPLPTAPRDEVGVVFVGAGNYAKAVLLPALARVPRTRKLAIATATGPSARRSAERYGFAACAADAESAVRTAGADLVFIATRHESHAALAADALAAGKAVWLEKPAALTPDELDSLLAAAAGKFLFVGFNRRFSQHARAMRDAFAKRSGALAIHYSVAAGPMPRNSWISEPQVGGGRVIGEVCHFVDLCQFLVGGPPVSVHARPIGRASDTDDALAATLAFADGSVATIEYLTHAAAGLPKERFEASADGITARCENYRRTVVLPGRKLRSWNQDKGQATAVHEVVEAVRAGAPSPISLAEIEAATRTTFAMLASLRTGAAEPVDAALPAQSEAREARA